MACRDGLGNYLAIVVSTPPLSMRIPICADERIIGYCHEDHARRLAAAPNVTIVRSRKLQRIMRVIVHGQRVPPEQPARSADSRVTTFKEHILDGRPPLVRHKPDSIMWPAIMRCEWKYACVIQMGAT